MKTQQNTTTRPTMYTSTKPDEGRDWINDIYDDGLCIECLDIKNDDALEPYYVSDDEQDDQYC